MREDLSLEIVVAVGCICGFIVLVLVLVLVLLCLQRHLVLKKRCEVSGHNENEFHPRSSCCPQLNITSTSAGNIMSGSTNTDNLNNQILQGDVTSSEIPNNQLPVFKTQCSAASAQIFNNYNNLPNRENNFHGNVYFQTNEKNVNAFETNRIIRQDTVPVTNDSLKHGNHPTFEDYRTVPGPPTAAAVDCSAPARKIVHEVVV
jgi:hypothetical protein